MKNCGLEMSAQVNKCEGRTDFLDSLGQKLNNKNSRSVSSLVKSTNAMLNTSKNDIYDKLSED